MAALYGTAKALCYLGDWLARENDEVWRSRAWAEFDGFAQPLPDPFSLHWGLGDLEGKQLEYVDPCQECDGSCGVCEALEMPTRPEPRTFWALRDSAFRAARDND